MILAWEVRRDEAPLLPASHPVDDHPPECVEAAKILLQKVSAYHFKYDIGALAVGRFAHLLWPVFLRVVHRTSAPSSFARSSFSCMLAVAMTS